MGEQIEQVEVPTSIQEEKEQELDYLRGESSDEPVKEKKVWEDKHLDKQPNQELIEEEVRVSKTTNLVKFSDSIKKFIFNGRSVKIITMGDESLGQCVKGRARLRQSLREKGIILGWYSDFEVITGKLDGHALSALVTRLEVKGLFLARISELQVTTLKT